MNERLRGFTFFGVELELPFGGALARRLLFRLWRKPQRWVMGGAMATIQLNKPFRNLKRFIFSMEEEAAVSHFERHCLRRNGLELKGAKMNREIQRSAPTNKLSFH